MSNFKNEIKDMALYIRYKGMKARCHNKNHIEYKNYGGRGIKVCEDWKKDYYCFQKWAYDNGYQRELQIDRIDTNGNYEPSNCRWVSPKINSNNRNNNHYIEYLGIKKTMTEWSEILNANYSSLRGYINTYHYDTELAFVLSYNNIKGKKINGNFDFDDNRLRMINHIKSIFNIVLNVKRNDNAILPFQAHKGDLYDCFSNEDITINSFESSIIHLGISFDIPEGYRLKVFSRSSLPLKKKLVVSNGVGIIDTGYKDEIGLICHSIPNISNDGTLINNPVQIHKGDKIAQFQIEKIIDIELEEVDELDMSNNRGGGFGSTDNN